MYICSCISDIPPIGQGTSGPSWVIYCLAQEGGLLWPGPSGPGGPIVGAPLGPNGPIRALPMMAQAGPKGPGPRDPRGTHQCPARYDPGGSLGPGPSESRGPIRARHIRAPWYIARNTSWCTIYIACTRLCHNLKNEYLSAFFIHMTSKVDLS